MKIFYRISFVLIFMFLQNCTAWPSLMALLLNQKSKDKACLVCLILFAPKSNSTPPVIPQEPNIPSNPIPVIVTDFTISPLTQTIEVSSTQYFVATNTANSETIDTGIEWTSSNTAIATIAPNGLATGVSTGTVTITATVGTIIRTAILIITPDTTSPTIISASSINPNLVRVVFSEPVANATTVANFKIASAPTGVCSDNTNFTSSTGVLTISSITQINSSTYDFNLTTAQTTGILYTLLGTKLSITDLAATPNSLGCPNNADFVGNEVLKVSSITCNTSQNIVVTFSKPIKTGINITGSAECNTTTECNNRYKISGATDLGTINSALVLNGTNCGGLPANSSRICITTSLLQNGAIYSVVTANNTNSDGFDNLAWGAIRNSADTENLQLSPKDRGSFFGCGIPSVNFVDGPIIVDPFTDGSDFGFLTTYSNKVYIGPNKTGNSASRFNADGSNPQGLTFSFEKDTTGAASTSSATTALGRQSRNSAAAPFNSIGGVGCTLNNNTAIGCGPDNQDGRGLFVSGILNGQEYLFISGYEAGVHSSPNNDYMYFSTDLDTNLSFKHIDTSRVFDICPAASPTVTQNQGTDSIEIFNNRIYWSVPGNGPNRPFIIKVNPPNPLISSVDIDCDTTANESHFINSRWAEGFGNQYNVTANAAPQNPTHGPAEPLRSSADMLGGVIQSYNNRLYAMNSGSIRYNGTGNACVNGSVYSAGVCEQTGGFTRSISNSPKTCASDSSCPEWVNITPTDTRYKQFFSIGLPTAAISSAPISAQKPIPKIEVFNGNLYAIRNSCRTVLLDLFTSLCNYGATNCTNDTYCASGDERPQLWKCVPTTTGSATDCDAGDWSLVADNGSGFTNFGDANNKQITMLQPNGSYLYVGFDNPNGIKVYRTNISNPSTQAEFFQIGGDGFGFPTVNKQIYSSITIQNGSIYFAYSSIGQNSTPVRVHRQQNN